MKRGKSIQALIERAEKDSMTLRMRCEDSLKEKRISEDLKIDIKNLFENLRSCLDYIAHDVFDTCVGGPEPKRLYFPIRPSKREFESALDESFPDLRTSSPVVYAILEAAQPYNESWLGKFNGLNNRNKHQDLEEQARTETKRVKVSKGGGSVSWGPGVRFGGGVKVMGAPIDPMTQLPVPNSEVTTEIVTWIDFRFRETGDSVLPFIAKSIESVKTIYDKLSKEI
jgi:hypothetical protein